MTRPGSEHLLDRHSRLYTSVLYGVAFANREHEDAMR